MLEDKTVSLVRRWVAVAVQLDEQGGQQDQANSIDASQGEEVAAKQRQLNVDSELVLQQSALGGDVGKQVKPRRRGDFRIPIPEVAIAVLLRLADVEDFVLREQ